MSYRWIGTLLMSPISLTLGQLYRKNGFEIGNKLDVTLTIELYQDSKGNNPP